MNSEMEEIPAAEPVIEEDLVKKHRHEWKELQSKIQVLKKSATKGDKKKKKEVAEEILKLEKDLEQKQAKELCTSEGYEQLTNVTQIENVINDVVDDHPEEPATRMSRAQKRRNKKLADDKEREARITQQEITNRDGPRFVELGMIKEILQGSGLQLYDIPADGNCLYCAVNHQLDVTGRDSFSVSKLRKLTAAFMKDNKEEFLPFMYHEDEEPFNEDQFEKYCKDVANTKLWGSQIELRALSFVLQCPIKVIQASGPSTVQGENFNGPPLVVTYHRHLYRLGEHYNSTMAAPENPDGEAL